MTPLLERMKATITPGLVDAFFHAAGQIGTTDLVVFLEEADGDEHSVAAAPRQAVADDPLAPPFLRELIKTPAAEMEPRAAPGDIAFWLVYFGSDGGSCCCAVTAKRLASVRHEAH